MAAHARGRPCLGVPVRRRGEARLEPFDAPPEDDLRFEFLRAGASTKYFRRDLFDAAVSRLTHAGYRVHVIDASRQEAFREQMTRILRLKENYGYEPWTGNLDALNDAFRDIDYQSVAGVVLAFVRFDLLRDADPYASCAVLDILEGASRDALLNGCQIIGLVQSDDPRLAHDLLGGRSPGWNRAEWLDADRGL